MEISESNITTIPKPTWYNNYYFRSKLEAKWAVFFDLMKIVWEYEPEAFTCEDGSQYTPDFYLPHVFLRDEQRGVYLEIKPLSYEDNQQYIKRISSSLKEKQLVLLVGDPVAAILNVNRGENRNEQLCPWWDNYMVLMYCNNCHTLKIEFDEGNYYNCPVCKESAGIIPPALSHAAEVARNFRFQFYDPRNK